MPITPEHSSSHQTRSTLTPALASAGFGRSGMIGISLMVFVREFDRDDPQVGDFRKSTGGLGGGPGSK
jgi:hypothetical protein